MLLEREGRCCCFSKREKTPSNEEREVATKVNIQEGLRPQQMSCGGKKPSQGNEFTWTDTPRSTSGEISVRKSKHPKKTSASRRVRGGGQTASFEMCADEKQQFKKLLI